MSSPSFYIPIQGTNECVEISNILSAEKDDLIDLLKLELAHPSLWHSIALNFYNNNDKQSFYSLLSTITTNEAQQYYKSEQYKASRIKLLNLLANYCSEKGSNSTDKDESVKYYNEAIALLNSSTELELQSIETW